MTCACTQPLGHDWLLWVSCGLEAIVLIAVVTIIVVLLRWSHRQIVFVQLVASLALEVQRMRARRQEWESGEDSP